MGASAIGISQSTISAGDVISPRALRSGFNSVELVVVVALLGLIGSIAIVRIFSVADSSRENTGYLNKGESDLQVQLYYRNEAVRPSTLGDLDSNPEYFLDGPFVCPVDGTGYEVDPLTHRVIGRNHGLPRQIHHFQEIDFMKCARKRDAFSLLELLAVVAILGIIAAVVVPRVSYSTAAAESAVDSHTAGQINAAIERYYIDNSGWPSALTDLVPDYLPDGVPTKSDGTAYSYDNTGADATYRVS